MPPKDPSRGSRRKLPVVLLLVVLLLAVFGQVKDHPFIPYDDDGYVYGNAAVKAGLTAEGAAWAFTTFHKSNWHPLAWLSHMADVEMFGPDAGRHHQVSLLFHVLNTVLLFHVLSGMTGAVGRSAFAAALFGIHPLHVESVAWVAERKDVLSAFFWVLAMWAYLRYAERGGRGRYLLVGLLFLLGLLSKPMVVTLPFVLLLLDYWPLNRFDFPRVFTEKIPLFVLSLASCVVTYVAQRQGGAVVSADQYPFGVRAANAAVSYALYLGKMFWPGSLAVFYPHPWDSPGGIAAGWVAGAVLSIAGISLFSLLRARRNPYLAVGWFWYLGTLVPVLGLVQAGAQGMADRYTYVPLIGPFLMLAWGIPEALAGYRFRRSALGIAAVSSLLLLAAASRYQVSRWRSGVSLFTHAVEATSNNWVMRNNLGSALAGEGRMEEAAAQFGESIRIRPDDAISRYNLGSILLEKGDFDGAIRQLRESVRLRPDYTYARTNLGYALLRRGFRDEAILHLREALSRDPSDALARRLLAGADATK